MSYMYAQTFILFESDINGVKITILWKIYSTQYSFNAFLLLLTLTLLCLYVYVALILLLTSSM